MHTYRRKVGEQLAWEVGYYLPIKPTGDAPPWFVVLSEYPSATAARAEVNYLNGGSST